MADNVIDNLSIQVTASAENAARVFDRLASSAGRLRGAASGAAGGLREAGDAAEEFGNTTEKAGTRSGEAARKIGKFWNALRGVGSQISGGFVQAVHRGTAAIGIFLKSIARIAFYRAIRSIIKDLGQSFKDLYGYSRLFGTDFAKSMDRITTASIYLRNSLAAMVAPLVNMFAPALDMIADKIVDILNFVNQLFAAINGQETYTVAKKVATTWESTFDSAADHANKRIKEVRNTLLGFDEINRLNGETPTTSGSTGSSPYTPGYSTMFEEKPLEGFFEKISNVTSGWPDWLKWLLGIGTVAIGAWGISKLPGLIGNIFDALKHLFSITIPDWFRRLFGGGGDDGDIGFDIPDKIDLPDADVPVNLKQGDWSVLQEIPTEKYLLLKVGVKMDGWLGNPQLPGNQPLVIDDNGSDTWDFTFQQAAMGANSLQAINNQLENMVDNWDDLAWEVAKMASGTIIDRTLRVAVKRSDNWDETAWDAANFSDGNVIRTVTAVVNQGDWDNTAWLAATMTPYTATRTIKTVVEKGSWDNTAWLAANMTPYTAIRTVKVETEIGVWDAVAWLAATLAPAIISRVVKVEVDTGNVWTAVAWLAATMATATIIRTVVSEVKKGEWDNVAWTAATMTAYAITRTITAIVKKGEWDAAAWLAANMTAYAITRTVTAIVKKGEWDTAAWSAANMTSFSPTRTVTSVVKTGEWDATAWTAATMTNYTVTRTVNVELKKKDWTTVTDFVDDSFGGATGGGGKTSGGGAGRSVDVGIKLTEDTTEQKGKSIWDMWWGIFNKTLQIEQDIAISLLPDWLGTPKQALGFSDLTDKAQNIQVALKKVADWQTNGIGKYLSINTSTVKITADVKKTTKWKDNKNGALGYLGLSGLTAVIKTKLQKENNNAVSYKIKAGGGTGKGVVAYELKRRGGVFSNGHWSEIPQYANGTLNAGTIFAAGEAGPEVVGHVGGRTEVLNKSQLASAMYSAVQAAMAPAAANFAAAAQSMGVADVSFDLETLAEMVRQGVEQAMGRQNELDRQRNEYLRQINEKDYAPEISTSSINKAQQRMNRRAGTTIVPVGT